VSESPAHSLYLLDLGRLVSERASDAKHDKEAATGAEDGAYAAGRLMGLHEVVSLMQEQAVAFGIPLKDIGLEGIDPERDLL
jgi:hypothetical protein